MTRSPAEEVAQLLLEKGAVSLRPNDPFRFASGILSPIYCDNRLLLSEVRGRRRIVEGLSFLATSFGAQQIAGIATAGIAWGAWVSEELQKPFVYVRSTAKEHGKKNRIEGKLDPRLSAALIEDLISTGGSVLSAAVELREAGVPVTGVCAIFSYEFAEAREAFESQKLPLRTLVNLDVFLETAVRMGKITEGDAERVKAWRKNPRGWDTGAR